MGSRRIQIVAEFANFVRICPGCLLSSVRVYVHEGERNDSAIEVETRLGIVGKRFPRVFKIAPMVNPPQI